MTHIESFECVCGALLEISEFELGLRGVRVSTEARCPMCERLVYTAEIDGLVIVEVCFKDVHALYGVAPVPQDTQTPLG